MRTLTLAAVLLSVAVPVSASGNPPIRLKLSEDTYAPGQKARVHIKLAQDGYLLVLQRDEAGHIRVLYPVDPQDNGLVKAGHDIEVRGRGDRDAFTVGADEGAGMVLAATSDRPFDAGAFTRHGRWDLAGLAAAANTNGVIAPEGTLLDLVDQMAEGQYQYDVVPYTVRPMRHYRQPYAVWYTPWWYNRPYYGLWPYYRPAFGYQGRFFWGPDPDRRDLDRAREPVHTRHVEQPRTRDRE